MRSADTNVLLRVLVRDDAAQAEAADAFVRPGAWVPHVVLAEAAWALDSVYGLKPLQIADALEMLLDHESLTVEDPEVVVAAIGRLRERPRVGFPDCLILETARRAGHLPLGTFERELGKLEGAERL